MAHDVGGFMPLFIADYLADTSHLTTVQHGAYLLLLLNYWRRGSKLPNSDIYLAQVARLPVREWQKHRDVIAELFTVTEGWWAQKRVEEELERARTNFKAKSEAGAKGAKKRWQKDGAANGAAIAEPSRRQCRTDATTPSPSPSPSHSPVGEESDAYASSARERVPTPSKITREPKGTRLANDWTLDPEGFDEGRNHGLDHATIYAVAGQFRDYWIAKSGKDACKTDWAATWRNWLKNHVARNGSGPWPRHDRGHPVAHRQGPASVLAAAASALSRIEAKRGFQRDDGGGVAGETGLGGSDDDGSPSRGDGALIDAPVAAE